MIITLALLLAPSQLTLPDKVSGQPSKIITVTAETTSQSVYFVALSDNMEIYPPSNLANKKSCLVVVPKPGKYRLMAYGAIENAPTPPAFTEIVVGDDISPPPDSSLTSKLKAAYGANSGAKKASLAKLVQVWETAKKTDLSAVKTNAELFNAIGAIHQQVGLEREELRAVRDEIGSYFQKLLGEDREAAVDLAKFNSGVLDVLAALKSLGGA